MRLAIHTLKKKKNANSQSFGVRHFILRWMQSDKLLKVQASQVGGSKAIFFCSKEIKQKESLRSLYACVYLVTRG